MNHTQIRAFHAVARLGSFSAAANALFLTQPAISEQVRRLEQENDVRLFQRTQKGVRLTESGEELFHFTKVYFEVEEQIDGCLSEWNARPSGHLRLVADSAMHVADVLTRFRTGYPLVKVTVRAGNTETILNELRNYNAEIGVVGSLPKSNDLVSVGIGSSPIIAFANKEAFPDVPGKLTLGELNHYPLVLREAGSKTAQHVLNDARVAGLTLNPAFEAEGREAVRSIVIAGGGIGFVSRAEFSSDACLKTMTITDLHSMMSESVIYLSQRKDVRLIRAFVEHVKEHRSEWRTMAGHEEAVGRTVSRGARMGLEGGLKGARALRGQADSAKLLP